MTDDRTRIFESHRGLLEGLAYRMLGTLADAQDVVQETWLHWKRADLAGVRQPRAWLVTVCTRLALDTMKSARARRETYVGAWLPEPLVDERAIDPAEQSQIDDSISLGLMLALEKLSPEERAAFLLHEIFAYRFDEIAGILNKTPSACRKLASRARASIRDGGPRFEASADEHQRLLEAFIRAARAGELDVLKSVLAEAVELHADGGGKATVVSNLRGAEAVARFFVRIWAGKTRKQEPVSVVTRWFNGVPGILIYEGGQLATALSLGIRGGRIHCIYAQRNPDKLARFERAG